MKKKNLLIAAVLFLIATCNLQSAFSQTTIPGGNVSGHWTLAGSPYNITGSVTIPTLTTLTIDPGVTVSFQRYSSLSDSGFTMFVQGQLLAVGTPADTITFTAADLSVGFQGIRFVDSYNYPGNDTSKLIYCKIQYGLASGHSYLYENGGALFFDNWSNAVVSHCLISNCYAGNSTGNGVNGNGGAIFCDSASSPVIFYNTICHNDAYAGYGGGIYCSYASNPLISYNTISYNNIVGGGEGGGIACYFSSPTISHNIISYNFGFTNGGGIFCISEGGYEGSPIISYNTISYNSISDANSYGGGISCFYATPTIAYNTISYNSVYASPGGADGAHGGGIYIGSYYGDVNDTVLFINNNTISYNSVGGEQSFGGGIACEGGVIISSLNNNTISYNSSNGFNYFDDGIGGGIYCSDSYISSMSYNTISNNFANALGGGVYCISDIYAVGGGSGIDSISNTTITNNTAGSPDDSYSYFYGTGGGFYCSGASPTMLNVIFANNYANMGYGGALYCDASAQPSLYNCILWGDSSSQSGGGNELFQNDALSAPSFYYCDAQAAESAFGLGGNSYIGTYANDINADPKFVSPSGGIGYLFDGVGADWGLQTGSPCIDAGDPIGIYPATDIVGNPRISGCVIDMGAYEYQKGFFPTPTPTVTASGSTSFCVGGSVMLSASTSSSYAWSNGATTQSISVTTTGNYSVIVTANGCSAISSVTRVTVNPLPAMNAVSNQTICNGASSGTVNFSGTGTVYNWTNNTPSIGLAASGTGNINSFKGTNSGTTPLTATITATPVSTGFAYIANSNVDVNGDIIGIGTVSVINTSTNTVTATIAVGNYPYAISVSPDGSRVYVCNLYDGTVSVINTATNTVIATIAAGGEGIAVSPDGSRLYVSDGGNISVINTATNAVISTIAVGAQFGIAVSPDGSRLYASSYDDGAVYVINTATNTVVATIAAGGEGIAASPDGSRVYATNLGGTVSVINTATNAIIAGIPVQGAPFGVSVSPDGSSVYVASSAGFVSVISAASNMVTATITIGGGATGISVSPDGSTVYVTNNSDNTVSVINRATNTVINTITVGNYPASFGNFVSGGGNCSGTPVTFNITVNPLPTATASSNSPVFENSTLNLTSSGGSTYSWTGPNGFNSIQQNPGISNVSPAAAGIYAATVTANGCSASSSLNVLIYPTGQAQLWSTAIGGGADGNGAIFNMNFDGTGYGKPHDFAYEIPGAGPYGSLIQATNGLLYGMTPSGDPNIGFNGNIFSFNPTTKTSIDLFEFNGTNGAVPYGSLMQATNGLLYGITYAGGLHDNGVLFSFNPATNAYSKLYDFDGTSGANPLGSLMQASNGILYGITEGGGDGLGVLFSFNPSSNTYTDLLNFDGGNGAEGTSSLYRASPSGLMQASNGLLYGMTPYGGGYNLGVLFCFDPSSNIYSKLLDFNGSNGANPAGGLMQASNGLLYGMTLLGGSSSLGNIFSFDPASLTCRDLVDFNDDSNGFDPIGSLIQASNGLLYGITSYGGVDDGGGVLFSFDPSSNTYGALLSFDDVNDENPYGSLMQASNGKLYGMTSWTDFGSGNGVLFSFDPASSNFEQFEFSDPTNGFTPNSNLTLASNGLLYGTTTFGGSEGEGGVIFNFNPVTNAYTKLLDLNLFDNPFGGLMQASNGKLYGIYQGGISGLGNIFSFDPSANTYDTLFSFNGTNGANPYGILMQATNGKLYGMTSAGGVNNAGVLFSFDPSSNIYSKLIDFNGTTLSGTQGSLIQATNGKLYGTAGNIFSFDPVTGTLSDLGVTGGWGSLIQATNGKLYGSAGNIFSFDLSSNTYSDLFNAGPNASYPAGLMQASNSLLYGGTSSGGTNGQGVLFSFNISTNAYTVLRNLNSPDGLVPQTPFIELDFISTHHIPAIMCAGNSLNVPYSVSIPFNTGNIFTAQLSDSSGSFASPVNIGTVTSTTSGSISATIPFNTPSGTRYRIRVTGSNLVITGKDNGSNIIIGYPAATASSNSPLCLGSTLMLTSGGGISYSWAGPNGFTSTLQNPGVSNVTSDKAGTYTVTVTATGGCSGTATAEVVLNTAPTITTINGPSTVCPGSAIQLSDSTSGGIWNSSNSAKATVSTPTNLTTTTVTGIAAGTDTIRYTVTGNSCTSVAVYPITVTLPAATITRSAATVCQGFATPPFITFTGTSGTAPFTFTYKINSGSSQTVSTTSGNSATVMVPTTNGGTFTYSLVNVADANGCQKSITGSAVVTVYALPVLIALSNSPVCAGSTLTLSSGGGTTYRWTGPNGYISVQQNPNISNIATVAAGTYTITATKNGCNNSANTIVIVYPKPTGTASPSPDSICSGSNTGGITLTGPVSGTTFTWTIVASSSYITGAAVGTSACPSCNIGDTILYNTEAVNAVNGTLTYNITPSANGCSGAVFKDVVVVKPVPVASTTASDTAICNDTKTAIHLTSNTLKTTFSWTTPSVTGPLGVIILNGVSGTGALIAQTLINSGTAQGIVTYTVTPAYLKCIGSPITVAVTVNPAVSGTATPASEAICNNTLTGVNIALSAGSLTIPAVSDATTYFTWTVALAGVTGGNPCSDHTGGCASPISDVLLNGGTISKIVTYTITPWAHGCKGIVPFTAKITVQPVPGENVNAYTNPICSGAKTNITLTPTTAGSTFNYAASITTVPGNSGTITGLPVNTVTGATTTIVETLGNTGSTQGEVSYTITPVYKTCQGSSFTVTETVNPVAKGYASPSPQGICSGSPAGVTLIPGTLTLPPVDGTTFTWTPSIVSTISGAQSGGGITIQDNLTTTASGPVEVYTITPSANGCTGTKFIENVTVQSGTPVKPTISGTATGLCISETYKYTITNLAPFNTVNWTLPSGCTVTVGSLTSNPVTISYPTGYVSGYVEAKVSNLCNDTSLVGSLKTTSAKSPCRTAGSAPEDQSTDNLIAYPNPTHDKLNVDFNGSDNSEYMIRMIDITGRLIIEKVADAVEGDNHVELDMGNLAKGIYILSFSSGEESKQVRIVVD